MAGFDFQQWLRDWRAQHPNSPLGGYANPAQNSASTTPGPTPGPTTTVTVNAGGPAVPSMGLGSGYPTPAQLPSPDAVGDAAMGSGTAADPLKDLSTVDKIKKAAQRVEAMISTNQAALQADPSNDDLKKRQDTLETLYANLLAKQADQEQKEKADALTKQEKPPRGTKLPAVRKTYNGVTAWVPQIADGTGGTQDDPEGTPTRDTSGVFPAQAPVNKTTVTDGQGNYWTFDPQSGEAKQINGMAGSPAKIQTLGDGSTWLIDASGNPSKKLTDAKPQSQVVENRLILTDSNTGKVITTVDLLDPQQRARADELSGLAVEQARQNLQPKFASAQAQYAQEAGRRQGMAQQELDRLVKLQQEGQISPDQAEAQFGAWMQTNVTGPLAGYKQAAEVEQQKLAQDAQTRQAAENTRVDEANRARQQLAYQAGEEARKQGIDIARQTRAPEFLQGMAQVSQAMAQGKPFAGFTQDMLDPANYAKVLPDVNQLADAAVNRLLARVSPATAQQVNVPLVGLPQGPDLQGMMDRVRYRPNLPGPSIDGPPALPPPEDTSAWGAPVPGQEAQDLGNGMARTTYGNGRYVDWAIPSR